MNTLRADLSTMDFIGFAKTGSGKPKMEVYIHYEQGKKLIS